MKITRAGSFTLYGDPVIVKLWECPNFGARHLCRITVQSNQGVEAG